MITSHHPRLVKAGQYAVLAGYMLFLAIPLLWLLSLSFKNARELVELHPCAGDHARQIGRQHHHVEAALHRAAANAAPAQCVTHLMPCLCAASRILSQVAIWSGSGLSPRGASPRANDRSAGPI